AVRRAHRAAGTHARPRRTVPTALAPALAPTTLATPANASAEGQHRGPAAKYRSSEPLSASPIVHTITKIVGVVPAPIGVAMGVLLLLVLASAVRSRLTARRARRLEI